MGLRAICQKPRTPTTADPAKRFLCLVVLKLVTVTDQFWATDVIDIPLQKSFLYLVAIVNSFLRNVLSWKLSNTIETEICLEAPGPCTGRCRNLANFHSDQGCQFLSADFVVRLQKEKITVS
jgi:putative transposase